MEVEDTPAELLTPPEKRLVQTLITLKPDNKSLVVSLSMVLFITFFSQIYWMNWGDLASSLPAVNQFIFEDGEIWRLFSSVLIHGDLGHLASNMYMLGILSYFVYGYFGAQMYPLWTFLGAGFVNLISVYTYPPHVRLLGASGWVYLLGGFWLTMYLFIQRQHSFPKRTLRVLGMALMVFFPTSFEATTSYRTHFIGFLVGIVMALFYFFKNKKEIRKYEGYKLVG